MAKARVDLDGNATVDSATCLVDREHDLAGIADIICGQSLDDLVDIQALLGQVLQVGCIVCGALGDGRFKDRGIGGDASHALVAHKRSQAPCRQTRAAEIVQPD